MPQELIVQECHLPFRAPALQRDGNINHARLILKHDDGSLELLYEGKDFNIKDWYEKMERQGYPIPTDLTSQFTR